MTRHHLVAAALLWTTATAPIAAPTSLVAQTAADTARLNRPLFVRSDLYILGMFTAATVAMFPLDRHLASVVRDPGLVANRDLRRVSSAFRFMGGPGPLLIGGTMYTVGRLAHVPRAAQLGLHGTEAVFVGAATSGFIKVLLGRARPYISADTNPHNFAFGRGIRGGTDYQSFPSGHSTSAFAAAAAVSTETAAWWPETRWIFGPILYGGAALVALSRIYDDKHWASDVIMGAAVGTFAGLKTVRFNQTHQGNRIDRLLLGESRGGARLRVYGDARNAGLVVNYAW